MKCWQAETGLCPHSFSVTGIVPNLTLTLTTVTLQMEGRWRLKIDNRIGSSEVDFQLRIMPSPFPDHTNRNMSTNDHDCSLGFIISACVGAIVLIAVINIVFCLIRRYRSRRESQAPEQPPHDQQPWRYSCGENETHMYWEIE
ncbi:hypothetical protein ACOMHN_062550 [Nucella lapillus]